MAGKAVTATVEDDHSKSSVGADVVTKRLSMNASIDTIKGDDLVKEDEDTVRGGQQKV